MIDPVRSPLGPQPLSETSTITIPDHKKIRAGVLDIAYMEYGDASGWPVILSHGFPFDVHAYNEVAPALARKGARVIVPYLRGFGPTRFASAHIFRSGQQTALGSDIVALLDALSITNAILGGYDWGGLASCVVACLWPERVSGLVSLASYDILDCERLRHAYSPPLELALWYQHLFQIERGRDCLTKYRRELCRLLWQQWCPRWRFEDATFDQTAVSFFNPDFIDVVIHSYRYAFGTTTGDPELEELEARLAERPKITVPSVTLDGLQDTLKPGGTADQASMFTNRHEHRQVEAGHNLPQEAPAAFIDAVWTVRSWLI